MQKAQDTRQDLTYFFNLNTIWVRMLGKKYSIKISKEDFSIKWTNQSLFTEHFLANHLLSANSVNSEEFACYVFFTVGTQL